MDWYCVDYWSEELGLDIAAMKYQIADRIAIHQGVPDFLQAVRDSGRRLLLVTNAHNKSLDLKMQRTRLEKYFDRIICSHDYGLPKEDVGFWRALQRAETFDPARTLLVDDSLSVLDSARRYGIRHLLAIYRPDTQAEVRSIHGYDAIHAFSEITPTIS